MADVCPCFRFVREACGCKRDRMANVDTFCDSLRGGFHLAPHVRITPRAFARLVGCRICAPIGPQLPGLYEPDGDDPAWRIVVDEAQPDHPYSIAWFASAHALRCASARLAREHSLLRLFSPHDVALNMCGAAALAPATPAVPVVDGEYEAPGDGEPVTGVKWLVQCKLCDADPVRRIGYANQWDHIEASIRRLSERLSAPVSCDAPEPLRRRER